VIVWLFVAVVVGNIIGINGPSSESSKEKCFRYNSAQQKTKESVVEGRKESQEAHDPCKRVSLYNVEI
jgi:hypothetical protein